MRNDWSEFVQRPSKFPFVFVIRQPRSSPVTEKERNENCREQNGAQHYFWFQVTVNDRLALRGPLLLPFLAGFTALSELDLSLDKSTIGGSSGSLLFIDDKILQQFFACLSSHFRNLQSLRINFWRVTLEDSEKTMRQIAKYLKLCNLSFLKANGLIVTDSAKKVQMEHVFVQTILTHLQYLTWLCLDGVDLTETQASSIGKCVRDRFPGTSLEISAKDVHVKSVKALVAAIEEGGRAEVVYTGGSNCRLKITKVQKSSKSKKKWRIVGTPLVINDTEAS